MFFAFKEGIYPAGWSFPPVGLSRQLDFPAGLTKRGHVTSCCVMLVQDIGDTKYAAVGSSRSCVHGIIIFRYRISFTFR